MVTMHWTPNWRGRLLFDFLDLGMCVSSKCLNLPRRGRAICRYYSILFPLASYSPCNYDATNWELHQISMDVVESYLATLYPRRTASYSVSLLETMKVSLIVCVIVEPSGVLKTMSTPPPYVQDDLLVSRIHLSSSTPWGCTSDLSTINCPLIALLGWYSHSLLDASSLWSMALIDNPMSTIMVWS